MDASTDRALVNGAPVKNSSELAAVLPCLVFNAQSFKLIEGAPDDRRRYFDWGVFHVEHSYSQLLASYKRALKQRNHMIKHNRSCIGTDVELSVRAVMIELGERITDLRLGVAQRLASALEPLLEEAVDEGVLPPLGCEFKRGYSDKYESLSDVLIANEKRDAQLGSTVAGPHKYDLEFVLASSGLPAKDQLSRGQIKRLVIIMKLAQLSLLSTDVASRVITLADDLPSELDAKQLNWALNRLQKASSQLFITTVEPINVVEYAISSKSDYQMFHVEHGRTIKEEQR